MFWDCNSIKFKKIDTHMIKRWSWFLRNPRCRWLGHKPGSRLSLLFTSPAVTISDTQHQCQHQIIQQCDRSTSPELWNGQYHKSHVPAQAQKCEIASITSLMFQHKPRRVKWPVSQVSCPRQLYHRHKTITGQYSRIHSITFIFIINLLPTQLQQTWSRCLDQNVRVQTYEDLNLLHRSDLVDTLFRGRGQ